MSKPRMLLSIALLLTAIAVLVPLASGARIDVVADTYHIVDGDTIDAFPVGRIRLADIDTPESGEAGYAEATAATRGYTEDKRVYLDVDSVDVEDNYQRLVAVVYVRHNATHLLNVNKALLDADLAVIYDFDNEFDPTAWTLYIRVPGPELPTVWEDARVQYAQVSANLSAKTAALADAQVALGDAEEDRGAALAELARVSAFLNGSVPASAELVAQLNSTRAQLEAAQAAIATTEAERTADQAAAQSRVDAATALAGFAWMVGAGAAAVAGLAAFIIGRRLRS